MLETRNMPQSVYYIQTTPNNILAVKLNKFFTDNLVSITKLHFSDN